MVETLAGIPFVAIEPHDLRFFRTPGVYAFARRFGSQRTLLFVGHAEEISAIYGGRTWNTALNAGMDEALMNLTATDRLDRLQVAAMIIRAYELRLNDTGAREKIPLPAPAIRRRT